MNNKSKGRMIQLVWNSFNKSWKYIKQNYWTFIISYYICLKCLKLSFSATYCYVRYISCILFVFLLRNINLQLDIILNKSTNIIKYNIFYYTHMIMRLYINEDWIFSPISILCASYTNVLSIVQTWKSRKILVQ